MPPIKLLKNAVRTTVMSSRAGLWDLIPTSESFDMTTFENPMRFTVLEIETPDKQQLLNSKSPMWPCIVIHKNEVGANGTSEQTHMGKKYLLTIAIPDYRPSIENVELSSPVQHNASSRQELQDHRNGVFP
ncbi:hypothetical protein TNCV_2083771 [Trichonephila clavipes]|uniref:Uncharacterized protein n=1 Tax=Trichonephila clavipes TaxID=2585209 RepID=A0A8X6RN52_TRICX|nr:hypothetical protein TNCV_2083771 [Trichonephila clavipes]